MRSARRPRRVPRTFASDNNSGVHPRVLAAIAAANEGHVRAYGDDPLTERVAHRILMMFMPRARQVFFVFNGTGANTLGLGSLARPWDAILCAEGAHIAVDEANAPERFTHAKLVPIPTPDGKLTPELLAPHVKGIGVEHHAQPRIVSVTQCTEVGTVYTLQELVALRMFCDRHDLALHMDGARLANAVATVGSLQDATFGVDVLSFGATKNGAMGAEAIVLFREMPEFKFLRKQGMQLASKMRYLAAQFDALLEGDLWLANARHANAMAALLAREAAKVPGVRIVHPTQANEVFAQLPRAAIAPLQEACYFYVWDEATDVVRWVCSWDTTEGDVRSFVEAMRKIVPAHAP